MKLPPKPITQPVEPADLRLKATTFNGVVPPLRRVDARPATPKGPDQPPPRPPDAIDDLSPAGGPVASQDASGVQSQELTVAALPSAPQPASALCALSEVLSNKSDSATASGRPYGRLIVDQHGAAYLAFHGGGNVRLYRIVSTLGQSLIRQYLHQQGKQPTRASAIEVQEALLAMAEVYGERCHVWRRVGRNADGDLVIDIGDELNTQIVISRGNVLKVRAGSEVLFARSPQTLPLTMPADGPGDIKLLRKYLNLDPVSELLLIAWISYTISLPKEPGSKYLFLVFNGPAGSGKSQTSKLVIRLIDPSRVGVQVMFSNVADLAIAGQSSHLIAIDNVRSISSQMSDHFCIASGGGEVSKRQLYTDADQHILSLHLAVIFNGIPTLVDQSDLAQRSLKLRLPPMSEAKRQSEVDLLVSFERDLPEIQAGLYHLIAKILEKLPLAHVTHPTRMFDFSKWLAALELVHGAPVGTYQSAYIDALNEGQLDSLQESLLASAVMSTFERLTNNGEGEWYGTPSELLEQLELDVGRNVTRSRDWPSNPIALSKRLQLLQASLRTQGIDIEFKRSKERVIGLRKVGEKS